MVPTRPVSRRTRPVIFFIQFLFLLIFILGIGQYTSSSERFHAEAKEHDIADTSPAITPVTSLTTVDTDFEDPELVVSEKSELVYLPIAINGPPVTAPTPTDNFHYGVFVGGGFVANPLNFESYIQDWQSHGFDAALVTNLVPDLSVSDRLNFKVVAAPIGDLYRQWFYYESYHGGEALCGGHPTIDCARNIIGPIVDPIKIHPSVIGYYIFDDAASNLKERIRLATQVFKERDPIHPASPGLLELGNGQTVYEHARPEAFITYDYSAWNAFPACDFTKGLFQDWVDRLRETMQAKPVSVPYWAILQAHGSESESYLRTPTVEEVRLLNWLALGEDAKGIFWFNWGTAPDQFWTGIKDNPALLAEITDVARRVNNLRPYFSVIRKISDKFQVTATGNAYASTLKDFSTGKLYVIAANHSCGPQELTLSSWYYQAKLKDLETGETVDLGSPLDFRGGDGKLYEVIDAVPITAPTLQPNLVVNPSFETDADLNGDPDGWGSGGAAFRDTTVRHSGIASLKITGDFSFSTAQVVTLKPGTKYYLSWYVKAQDLDESQLTLRYVQTSPEQAVLDTVAWTQNGSYDWVKRVGFFETPADYQSGKILIMWNVRSGATFWIDDLTLCAANLPCRDAYLKERDQIQE